jgi:UDP-glucose 4-epimerase
MAERRIVLITGASGYWGSRLAARLLTLPDVHVIGVDATVPKEHVRGLDFIQADIRNALVVDLLREERVDTVCHLALVESERRSETTFELNVMGAMRMFGACSAAGVRKIIFRSSTEVYGARPDNSAFLTEERALTTQAASGTVHNLVEIEAFCNGFRGQNPDVVLTVLRFPSIVGPKVDSPMTRFLSTPLTPFLMGFDPMMQVIHEDDVVEALAHAVLHDAPGVFNVAAEGLVPLSKLMALAGKFALPVFHLAAYWGNPVLGGLGLPVNRLWPIDLDYLRYPWVGDLTRMRQVLDYPPRYTAIEALREFAGRKQLQQFGPDATGLAYDEERLRDTIERRRRARERLPHPSQPSPDVLDEDAEEEAL